MMSERYDTAAAAHYAGYRPPLHELILDRALGKNARFAFGIDVGCGTGRSTVALAAFCERTVGIDPSASMLSRADPRARVSYLVGAGDSIPIPESTADIISFAGSLHYANSEATRSEVQRVGRSGATIIVYDFDLHVAEVLSRMGIELPVANSDYNHAVNFAGQDGFVERDVIRENTTVEMSTSDFAHLVLSDSNRLDHLVGRYGPDSIHESLERAIKAAANTDSNTDSNTEANADADAQMVSVTASLYFSLYFLG